ncbi:unnamed protein product [Calypogeia fissa]
MGWPFLDAAGLVALCPVFMGANGDAARKPDAAAGTMTSCRGRGEKTRFGEMQWTFHLGRSTEIQTEDFDKAAKDAVTLPTSTTDESKLILYGLFKQATVGNMNTSRLGMFNFKGKAKWDAWKKVKGKSKEEAQQDYVTKVTQLLEA